jgi:hypothetical protein
MIGDVLCENMNSDGSMPPAGLSFGKVCSNRVTSIERLCQSDSD